MIENSARDFFLKKKEERNLLNPVSDETAVTIARATDVAPMSGNKTTKRGRHAKHQKTFF